MGWVFEHNNDPDFNNPLPEDGESPAAASSPLTSRSSTRPSTAAWLDPSPSSWNFVTASSVGWTVQWSVTSKFIVATVRGVRTGASSVSATRACNAVVSPPTRAKPTPMPARPANRDIRVLRAPVPDQST